MRPGIKPRTSCSSSWELNHYTIAAPSKNSENNIMNHMSWTYFTYDICIGAGVSGSFHGNSSVHLSMCDGVAQNSAICFQRWLPGHYDTCWCCLVTGPSDLFWHCKSQRFFNKVHKIRGSQGHYVHTQFDYYSRFTYWVCQWKQCIQYFTRVPKYAALFAVTNVNTLTKYQSFYNFFITIKAFITECKFSVKYMTFVHFFIQCKGKWKIFQIQFCIFSMQLLLFYITYSNTSAIQFN